MESSDITHKRYFNDIKLEIIYGILVGDLSIQKVKFWRALFSLWPKDLRPWTFLADAALAFSVHQGLATRLRNAKLPGCAGVEFKRCLPLSSLRS